MTPKLTLHQTVSAYSGWNLKSKTYLNEVFLSKVPKLMHLGQIVFKFNEYDIENIIEGHYFAKIWPQKFYQTIFYNIQPFK